jgi:hypothetical protein
MSTSVEDSARRLIVEHGAGAVFVAIDRLNSSIDRADWEQRDFWAQVVHAIHDYERSGELPLAREPSARKAEKTDGN